MNWRDRELQRLQVVHNWDVPKEEVLLVKGRFLRKSGEVLPHKEEVLLVKGGSVNGEVLQDKENMKKKKEVP